MDPPGPSFHTVHGIESVGDEITLTVEVRPEPDAIVVVLAGDLEVSTAGQLRDILDHVPLPTPNVVLDLEGLDFVDSTGIGCLFKLQRRAADLGGIVVARNPQAQIHRVMEMTQLNRLIAIVDR